MEWRRLIQGIPTPQTSAYSGTYGGDFTGFVPSDAKDVNNVAIPIPACTLLRESNFTSSASSVCGAGQALSTPDASGNCTATPKVAVAQNPIFAPFNANKLPFLDGSFCVGERWHFPSADQRE